VARSSHALSLFFYISSFDHLEYEKMEGEDLGNLITGAADPQILDKIQPSENF